MFSTMQTARIKQQMDADSMLMDLVFKSRLNNDYSMNPLMPVDVNGTRTYDARMIIP